MAGHASSACISIFKLGTKMIDAVKLNEDKMKTMKEKIYTNKIMQLEKRKEQKKKVMEEHSKELLKKDFERKQNQKERFATNSKLIEKELKLQDKLQKRSARLAVI